MQLFVKQGFFIIKKQLEEKGNISEPAGQIFISFLPLEIEYLLKDKLIAHIIKQLAQMKVTTLNNMTATRNKKNRFL